jgi:hypothetical protein
MDINRKVGVGDEKLKFSRICGQLSIGKIEG